jgi:hypothetical protein
MTDALIDELVAGAAHLGLMFSGVPESDLVEVLGKMFDRLRADLVGLGASEGVADFVAQAFITTVVRRKMEIDSSAGNSGTMQ